MKWTKASDMKGFAFDYLAMYKDRDFWIRGTFYVTDNGYEFNHKGGTMTITNSMLNKVFIVDESTPSVTEGAQKAKNNGINIIRIEMPQHENLIGCIDVISDDYDFNYADLGTHHGMKCAYEADTEQYNALMTCLSTIANEAKKIIKIHSGDIAFLTSTPEEGKDAAKEYAKDKRFGLAGSDTDEQTIYLIERAFLAGASWRASRPPAVESEAGLFAEWCSRNGWSFWPTFPGTPTRDKQPVWIHESDANPENPLPTTSELYQLFLNSK